MNDNPWEPGLYPLCVRGVDSDGWWLHGATVKLEPALGVLYSDRSPVPAHEIPVERHSAQFNALVPPGRYTVSFTHRRESPVRTVVVADPYAQVTQVDFLGSPFHLRAGTWDAYILKENSYTQLTIEPADVVADMGAHVGVFSRRALAAGARVIAWEPEPINVSLLEQNLSLVPGADFEIVPAAVVCDDTTDPEVTLWIDADGDGDAGRTALHSLRHGRGPRFGRRVPAVHFGSELRRVQPTVLKVDVEGSELTYDWSLVPDSVREIAVELEESKKRKRSETEKIRRDLTDLGFTLVHETVGWSTVQTWRRQVRLPE